MLISCADHVPGDENRLWRFDLSVRNQEVYRRHARQIQIGIHSPHVRIVITKWNPWLTGGLNGRMPPAAAADDDEEEAPPAFMNTIGLPCSFASAITLPILSLA